LQTGLLKCLLHPEDSLRVSTAEPGEPLDWGSGQANWAKHSGAAP